MAIMHVYRMPAPSPNPPPWLPLYMRSSVAQRARSRLPGVQVLWHATEDATDKSCMCERTQCEHGEGVVDHHKCGHAGIHARQLDHSHRRAQHALPGAPLQRIGLALSEVLYN